MAITLLVAGLCFCGSTKSVKAILQSGASQAAVPVDSFDTVSIRLSKVGDNTFAITPNPNNFQVTGATVALLARFAFGLEDYQARGGPPWVNVQHFDLVAKSDPANNVTASSSSYDERHRVAQARVRSLLADRFHLRFHRETRLLPGYVLLLAKSGPKMAPANPEGGYSLGRGTLIAKDFGLDDLASILSGILGRTVIDKTGNSGHFSFTLKWSSEEQSDVEGASPALFTALQEQLGLRLERQKLPTDMLIIDNASEPTPN